MSRVAILDVLVEYDAVERAREEAIEHGRSVDWLTVSADVDIEDALEEASADQLRAALSHEDPGYTLEQVDAIRDCFAAMALGDTATVLALIPRIFEHQAQIVAAETGLRVNHRRAA